MKKLLTISLMLTVLVLAGAAQAADYVMPFWDSTAGPQGALLGGGPNGSTWYVGNNTGAAPRIEYFGATLPQIWQNEQYTAENGWVYDMQQGTPTAPEWVTAGTGVSSYGSDKMLRTWGIVNQYPRAMLIFEAPSTGYYSFDGKVQWDWWYESTGGDTPDGDVSQIRFNIDKVPAAVAGGPATNWGSKTGLASQGTASFNIVQASGSSGAVDLGSIPELQGMLLYAGDYLAIRTGSRGLLMDGTATHDEVWDTSSMNLAVDGGDPAKIVSRTPVFGEFPWAQSSNSVVGDLGETWTAYEGTGWTNTAWPASMDPMVWDASESRLENSEATIYASYDEGKKLISRNGDNPMLRFEVASAGTYNLDGIVHLSNIGTAWIRFGVYKYDANTGAATQLYWYANNTLDTSYDVDLGVEIGDIVLAVGDSIGFGMYSPNATATDYLTADFDYFGNDPARLTPEPATLVVLGLGALLVSLQRRRS